MSVPNTVDNNTQEASGKNRHRELLQNILAGGTTITGLMLFLAHYIYLSPILEWIFGQPEKPLPRKPLSLPLPTKLIKLSAGLFGIELLGGWIWSKMERKTDKEHHGESKNPSQEEPIQSRSAWQKTNEKFGAVIGLTTSTVLGWLTYLSIARKSGEKLINTRNKGIATGLLTGLLGVEVAGYAASRMSASPKNDKTEPNNSPESKFIDNVTGAFGAFIAAFIGASLSILTCKLSYRKPGEKLITKPVKLCSGLAASGAAGYLVFDTLSHQKQNKPTVTFTARIEQEKLKAPEISAGSL